MLSGQAKKDYQREYMREWQRTKRGSKQRSKQIGSGSKHSSIGLNNSNKGLTEYGCGCVKEQDSVLCSKHGRA